MLVQLHGVLQQGTTAPSANYININPNYLTYTYDCTPCITNAVSITASGSWTASWTSGYVFLASQYSGSGNATIYISCLYLNEDPFEITDYLNFTRDGSTATLTCVQFEYGAGCS